MPPKSCSPTASSGQAGLPDLHTGKQHANPNLLTMSLASLNRYQVRARGAEAEGGHQPDPCPILASLLPGTELSRTHTPLGPFLYLSCPARSPCHTFPLSSFCLCLPIRVENPAFLPWVSRLPLSTVSLCFPTRSLKPGSSHPTLL